MINQASRMDYVAQSYVADNQFMGTILVARNGQIILSKGYGYANLEWEVQNTPITKFRIASLTKQFTAAAVLLLEEKKKLKINEPITRYIPDAPSAWKEITIFNLLTHTSGIPNYTRFPNFSAITTMPKTPVEQIALFRNHPLNFLPGVDFEYNNSAYVLLGYLIEQICGQSYENFVMDNIFKPLEMNDSGYDSHSQIILHRASGYMVSPKGLCNAEYLDMSIPYSAGSLYSTTEDLLRWEKGLFEGKILSTTSVKKMMTPFKNDYGLGVRIYSLDRHQTISHAGGTSGFNTKLIYCPDDKLTVIVLANLNALGYIAQNLAFKMVTLARGNNVILPSERKESIVASNVLANYTGTYNIKPCMGAYGLTPEKSIVLSLENGCLMAEITNQPKIQLFPESENKFFGKVPDIQIEFFNKKNQISHLVLHQDGETSMGLKFS